MLALPPNRGSSYHLLLNGVIKSTTRSLIACICSVRLGQISPSIEEAAISLGATEMKTFSKVTIPMMMPGVLAGAIMSWVTIISELSSSIILYTNANQTLTVSVYTEVIRGNYGNASAYATILTITSILSLLLFYKITGRRDISL